MYSGLNNLHRKIGNIQGQLYDGNGLQDSLKELFTPFRKMKDLMKPTVITAHSVGGDNKPILITSDDDTYKDWDVSEAILAATSSPYFFPATTVGDESSQ